MAAPSVTNTFTNGTTADATEVNQNFTDIINGLTDGTEDLTISAITANGAATFNGTVTLGNASGDTVTFNGYIGTAIVPDTNATYALGSQTLNWSAIYLDNGATDGGAVYFDADGTTFIKANAAGTDINISGSTTLTIAPLLVVADGSTAAPSIYSSTGTSDTGISMGTADQVHISAGGIEVAQFAGASSETVLNETGADIDFRVEGDTNASLLFVNAGKDSVCIGTSTYAPTTMPELVVTDGSGSGLSSHFGSTLAAFISNDTNDSAGIAVIGGTSGQANLYLGDSGVENAGGLSYDNSTDDMILRAADATRMTIYGTNTGEVARVTSTIGTTDGNNAQLTIYDSTLNGTVASLGVRYEDTATAGPSGYVGMRERDGGQTSYIWADYNGILRISGTFSDVGTAGATVVGTQTSDERLKSNIRPLEYGLKEVLALKPIRYELGGNTEIGFGAQTTEKILPEAVHTSNDGLLEPSRHPEAAKANTKKEMKDSLLAKGFKLEDELGRKTMEYARVIPVLVNAIKELKEEIDKLKAA